MLNQSARTRGFPLPLASTAYHLFQQAFAAGHAADDCKTLEIYLSGRGSLESFPSVQEGIRRQSNATTETIQSILAGIHSAVAIEALLYAQELGVPASEMRRVVKSAAGSSTLFDKIAESFQDEEKIYLRAIGDFETILQRLVSTYRPTKTK